MTPSKRIIKRAVLSFVVLVLIGLLFSVFGRDMIPSRLTLYAPQQMWKSVSVDGNQVLVSGTSVQISPLSYGPHDLRFVMADGKIFYATFFHSDTGVDRQVNIYVNYQPYTSIADFRQTITRYETFPGRTRTVFTGNTHPEQTSKTNPFMLDWI